MNEPRYLCIEEVEEDEALTVALDYISDLRNVGFKCELPESEHGPVYSKERECLYIPFYEYAFELKGYEEGDEPWDCFVANLEDLDVFLDDEVMEFFEYDDHSTMLLADNVPDTVILDIASSADSIVNQVNIDMMDDVVDLINAKWVFVPLNAFRSLPEDVADHSSLLYETDPFEELPDELSYYGLASSEKKRIESSRRFGWKYGSSVVVFPSRSAPPDTKHEIIDLDEEGSRARFEEWWCATAYSPLEELEKLLDDESEE